MAEQAELDISLRRKEEGVYALEFRFRHPDKPVDEHLGQEEPVLARLDPEALSQLTYDPPSYARKLTDDFFADRAGLAFFARVRAKAGKLPLRIRLAIAADAAEVHSVYWETLLDPESKKPLFTGENVTFARYIASPDGRAVQLEPKKALKALVAVANPSDLSPEQAIDARAEYKRAIQELGGIQGDSLGVEAGSPSVTLDNLVERLRELQPTILYLVCHGALSKGEPYLILEKQQGGKEIVRGEDLVTRLNELARPPLLVVLASCQSAGRPGSIEARAALGPRLAASGVAAVVAMQGDVSQETVAEFMPVFFRQLAKDGRPEYAMSLARGRVRERLDFWMPALFTRLETIYAPRVIPWVGYGFAALGAVILALIAGGAWYANRFTPMGPGFNIAVAEFGVQDENGRFVSTEQGRQFSDSLYRSIENSLTNINIPGSLLVEFRPPDEVGRVEGDTPEERSAEAGLLAEKHNATLLIYGVITQNEPGYQVEPAFYVNNSGWDYGGEVAGPQRLGQPIPVDLSGDVAAQFTQNSLLEARVRALRNLVDGLGFYYNQKYELAAGYFQQAAYEAGWSDEQGKEVVYTLLGAAYLRSFLPAGQELTPLERSRRAFNTAVSINPDYARGYLGLGSAALQQAGELRSQGPDQAAPWVWEGQDWFLTAQKAPDKPERAFVDTKVAYGLGLVNLLGSDLGMQNFSTAGARASFEQVLEDYAAFKQPAGLVWHQAMARYYLGLLAMESEPQTALAYCQQSLDSLGDLSASSGQVSLASAYAWECIGRAQAGLGNLERAAEAYQRAIEVGGQSVAEEVLDLWEAILPQLNSP